MRKCNYCKKSKDESNFSKDKSKASGFKSYCKECAIDKQTIRNFKKRYGISDTVYKELLGVQDNKCKICGITLEENKKAFSVDHCHQTKEIRGLLCNKCNVGLGMFDDKIENLINAISYLMSFNDKQHTLLSCPQ